MDGQLDLCRPVRAGVDCAGAECDGGDVDQLAGRRVRRCGRYDDCDGFASLLSHLHRFQIFAALAQNGMYRIFEKGLAPLTVGLVLTGAYLLTGATVDGVPAFVVTATKVAYIFVLKKNPLYVLVAAAIAGAAGFV